MVWINLEPIVINVHFNVQQYQSESRQVTNTNESDAPNVDDGWPYALSSKNLIPRDLDSE